MKYINNMKIRTCGATLLEVVLAIVIFAVGMMALIQLQGSVARSSTDSNARTVAASLAEEIIETAKGFTSVPAAANGRQDYNEIVDYTSPQVINRGNFEYTTNVAVTDYYFDSDTGGFTSTAPTGAVFSDFKVVDITIVWNADSASQLAQLGSGDLRVKEIVSSTPGLIGARIFAEDDGELGTPAVDYHPGDNPDIVKLSLGDGTGRFKESTSPQPDVIRDDKTETWFDVVTYSQSGDDAVFQRREEFVAVSCECELNAASSASPALRPTLWNGFDYTEGDLVEKPYGTVPNGVQQSPYCDLCCRDHHDGGDGGNNPENIFNPLVKVANGNSDHEHYGRDNRGVLNTSPATTASNNNGYIEACRLIRKDGFMRVTKDAVQQGLFGFPEDYLTFDDSLGEYSDYVIAAAEEYYEEGQISFDQPTDVGYVIPASEMDNATDLPTPYLTDWQQLRSRGVYTDYLTEAAALNIEHCFDDSDPPTPTPGEDGCNAPNVSSPLEIYPFFDLQMTWLARWNENPAADAIDVTNQAVATGNTHSRGMATLQAPPVVGQTTLAITAHKGNLGLTATGGIDGTYDSNTAETPLFVDANGDSTPAPSTGFLVSGSLSSGVSRVNAADLVITSVNTGIALCGQTDTTYSCLVKTSGGQIIVSGYYKKNTALWICSDLGVAIATTPGEKGLGTATTTFALPSFTRPGVRIWISGTISCL